MTKWACYCRVSLDIQSQAIQNQKMVLSDYCGRMGIQYDLYEEIESTKKTRYQKYLLLQKLRKGEYAGVIVTKLDRWGRTLTELVMELNEFATDEERTKILNRHGIKVIRFTNEEVEKKLNIVLKSIQEALYENTCK